MNHHEYLLASISDETYLLDMSVCEIREKNN